MLFSYNFFINHFHKYSRPIESNLDASLPKKYLPLLRYVESYWKKITFGAPQDRGIVIGLPHPFVSPNNGFYKGDQFCWDTYFITLGLMASGRIKLAKGMAENLAHLFRRFGLIPLRNRIYNLGTSQIPFFTSIALEIFGETGDKKWLAKMGRVAEDELKNYWLVGHNAERHLIYRGLSRYADHFITHATAEHESGWDMTSRFDEKCLNYLPVDLNSCLYKYETDLARIARLSGNWKKEWFYLSAAAKRAKTMRALMWDKRVGFFFDYNHREKRRSNFYSLAGFYPLWAGLATQSEAEAARKNLKHFEYAGGLANTGRGRLSKEFKQWDYPNGWANQHWIVIKGLLNYGFRDDALRIAEKWLDLNIRVFKKTGKMWEKYDVVKMAVGKSGRYKTQSGFGWTNSVYIRLICEFYPRYFSARN